MPPDMAKCPLWAEVPGVEDHWPGHCGTETTISTVLYIPDLQKLTERTRGYCFKPQFWGGVLCNHRHHGCRPAVPGAFGGLAPFRPPVRA